MTRRHDHMAEKARRSRVQSCASVIPSDRHPAASPTSAPIRTRDAATEALIADFLRKKRTKEPSQ